jgi:hypothetical protein
MKRDAIRRPGQDARQPQLPDGLARDHAVEHQHDARRDEDAERGARLDDAGDHDLVVAASQASSGSAMVAPIAMPATDRPLIAEMITIMQIVPMASPRAPARTRRGTSVEIVGEPRFRQHVAHEDEQRQRQQRIPLHQLDGGGERNRAAGGPTAAVRRHGTDETDHREDPLPVSIISIMEENIRSS